MSPNPPITKPRYVNGIRFAKPRIAESSALPVRSTTAAMTMNKPPLITAWLNIWTIEPANPLSLTRLIPSTI